MISLFTEQAQKRNGQQKGGLFFSRPYLTFSDGSLNFKVAFEKRQNTVMTMMSCPLLSSRNTVCLFPQQYGQIKIVPGPGVQDVKVDYPEFDQAFIIQGSSDFVTREYLTAEIQQELLQMKELYPSLQIKDQFFKFYVPEEIKDARKLDNFIRVGMLLARRAK